MLTVESRATVPGLSGTEITRLLLDCTDVGYQAWSPGVQLQLPPLAAGGVDHVGDVVFMDEIIGALIASSELLDDTADSKSS